MLPLMGSGVESLADGRPDSDEDGDRCMTEEESRLYNTAALKSDGFDVPLLPETGEFGRIEPILNPLYIKYAREHAQVAIDHYNRTQGESYEIVKLKKANFRGCRGIMYYITFYVRSTKASSDAPLMTFQAQVLHGLPDEGVVVELCRPEPEEHKDLCSLDAALLEGLY